MNDTAQKETGIISIRGKQYHTVAKRITDFREANAGWRIQVEVLTNTPEMVLMRADIIDTSGNIVAQGHAEEVRTSTGVNSTSALENCETSAVGRALAFYAYGGTDIASADEMSQAVIEQGRKEAQQRAFECMQAYQANRDSVDCVQKALAEGDYATAVEAFYELSDEIKTALNLAHTKGGCWTTKETQQFKSSEWTQAREEHFGI